MSNLSISESFAVLCLPPQAAKTASATQGSHTTDEQLKNIVSLLLLPCLTACCQYHCSSRINGNQYLLYSCQKQICCSPPFLSMKVSKCGSVLIESLFSLYRSKPFKMVTLICHRMAWNLPAQILISPMR